MICQCSAVNSSKIVQLDLQFARQWVKLFSRKLNHAAHVMGPTLAVHAFAGAANLAHAQGTIGFSGAQTFMQTVQTFAEYAGVPALFMKRVLFQMRRPCKALGAAWRELPSGANLRTTVLRVCVVAASSVRSEVQQSVSTNNHPHSIQKSDGRWRPLLG